MWAALTRFTGIIAGAERVFAPGDKITDTEAAELGLAAKPGLAIKGKLNGAETKKA